ncbi:type II secretion system protein C (GspC) [Sphingomonas guangdongensis]|uniref:Type II secretion system protein C (GspC) n=1 Tax=Sphingomonas guangdongensis TaxID=1141890 RepID=A0A285QYX1_9SPHN|nr:type II secretion system protein N [Sphingomonas guangdongensis]SOB86569.1 type II secretion system protein C (GspC) [Sphingomonas guangdongensis]
MRLAPFALTPYRMARALDVLTALVVASVAVALAHLTWRLAGHADTGAITVPPVARPVPVTDVGPAIALAPFGRAGANGEGAPATTLQVALKGIVFARPESLSIAYISAGAEAPKPYRVGEAVSGATVQAIQVNRVLLLNGGRTEALAFPDPFATAGQPAPIAGTAAVPATPPPVSAAPATAAGNPAALLNRLDAQPVDGGYRIGENAPPGLRAGDVVSQVNGQALTSPDAARDAFAKAQASGSAQITIMRDGRPVTLTVPTQ